MDGRAARPTRSRRDRVVDVLMLIIAFGAGIVLAAQQQGDPSLPIWLQRLDQVAGALGCVAVWLRRRWPVGLAVALIALSAFSELVTGALLIALFTVAVHRTFRVSAGLLALAALAVPAYLVIRPEPGSTLVAQFALAVAMYGAVIGWGLYVRSRRQLVRRAESEARLRTERAQHEAREQIAREMHDVLGHRLSLLSVHAGSLEFRPDAPPEEIARAAGVIRASAHLALQDLREVIGVLRAPVGELPSPTLADLPDLVAESVRAGALVDLATDVDGPVPTTVGRTAYRIVQEGLTNARKHAPGAPVEVRVDGGPGDGLTVTVVNEAPATAAPAPGTGSGQGLTGLAERAALVGGDLSHGPTDSGGFRLHAWLRLGAR